MARWIRALVTFAMFLVPLALLAQAPRDVVPLKSWPAPLFFQPTRAESRELARPNTRPDTVNALSSDVSSLAATPAGSLVFVAMTPCRIADTRDGTYPAGFGPPSLVGNASRTFAIQSPTSRCPVPSVAQAYSFNITVVPPGATFPGSVNPSGALGYLTIWPTGVAQPFVSTLNSYLGTVAANAAIVPAGTNGSVDVFVYNNTDVVIDINGYYAPQSGITLAQGTATAPSLSFAGDPGTGIFSSGAGTLNVTTAGSNRLSVDPSGNVGIGTVSPSQSLEVDGITSLGPPGSVYGYSVNGGSVLYPTIGFNTYGPSYVAGATGYGGILQFQNGDGSLIYYTSSNVSAGTPHANVPAFTITTDGRVGIGTSSPESQLEVISNSGTGVFSNGGSGVGVYGSSISQWGVYGFSNSSYGVYGGSNSSYGVYGHSGSSYAGYFQGNVFVTGTVTQGSDARLKEGVSNLSYGLTELMQLRPVSWTWKEKPDQGVQLGLIAQEAETVVPELVSTDKGAEQTKGINYIGLVPVTIKAIQQQQSQIEEQQKRIAEQQRQLDEQQQQNRRLEERLAALEKLLSTMQANTAAQ